MCCITHSVNPAEAEDLASSPIQSQSAAGRREDREKTGENIEIFTFFFLHHYWFSLNTHTHAHTHTRAHTHRDKLTKRYFRFLSVLFNIGCVSRTWNPCEADVYFVLWVMRFSRTHLPVTKKRGISPVLPQKKKEKRRKTIAGESHKLRLRTDWFKSVLLKICIMWNFECAQRLNMKTKNTQPCSVFI